MPKKTKLSGATYQVAAVTSRALPTMTAKSAEEGFDVQPLTGCQDEADADQREERASGQPGEDDPARIAGDIDRNQVAITEVEGGVIDHHGDDGDAAHDVDRRNAGAAGIGKTRDSHANRHPLSTG